MSRQDDEKGEEQPPKAVPGEKHMEPDPSIQSLLESGELYKAVFENTGAATVILDDDTTIGLANTQFERLSGYPKDEVEGKKSWTEFIVKEDLERMLAQHRIRRTDPEKALTSYEFRFVDRAGKLHHIHINIAMIPGTRKSVASLLDITERREAEDAVRESGERYRLIMENANDGIMVNELTPEGPGRFIDVNNEACRILGMTREELKDTRLIDLDAPEIRQRATDILRQLKENRHMVIQTIYRPKAKNEKVIEVSVSLFDLHGLPAMLSVVREVTERWQIEKAIRQQNQALEIINTLAADLAALPYEESIQKRALRALQEISGAVATWFSDYDPSDQTLVLGEIETDAELLRNVAAVAGIRPGSVRSPVNDETYREITGSIIGRRRTLTEISFGAIPPRIGSLVQSITRIDRFIGIAYVVEGELYGTSAMGLRANDPDPPDEILLAFAHVVAISLRRRNAEMALRQSEEKFRSIVENMQDIYYRTDNEGRLVMASPSAAKIMGYRSPDEMVGKKIIDNLYTSPEDLDRFIRDLDRNGSVHNRVVTLRKRDGTPFIVSASCQFYYDKSGKILGVEGIVHDINEITKVKDALSAANKKLGLLSSVTRHDVLNKLTVLMSHLGFMEKKTADPDLLAHIAKAKNAGETIRQQIEFTKIYHGLGLHEPQWVEVGKVLQKLQAPPGISLSAAADGFEILADPLLIKVFENLLDNTVRHGQKATAVTIAVAESDPALTITYEDNGDGIPADMKESIFEWGYGRNTGFGLFLVREILAITGMKITETGKHGAGARFVISVPKGAYRIAGKPAS
ncbi:MAG: sensory histidine kinase AtoS [Methanoregula sp. PtaU1.Bin051]|nr:MAG: sensory histidine kinase AtoS [Methanoregula sp. PtaU1.Bin051]